MADLASQFLTRDYTKIFDDRFTPKLLSAETANYMTRRMALQILSTVLLTRSNYNVMIKYIASKQNLVNIMLLLRDTSPHITLDAFHVFKIFVANPNKPPEIIKILTDNKVKLCKYLESLHKDREEADPQFRDEKALVISTIEAL
jgi:calcium binding protein 39